MFGLALVVLSTSRCCRSRCSRTLRSSGSSEDGRRPRYYVGVFLFLIMMALPIKMVLRWLFNLKYIVAIPEFAFNI